jgi:hypothetical protein
MTVANFKIKKIGTVAVGAGKMIAEGCGYFMVYTSSMSCAEVCDIICHFKCVGRKKLHIWWNPFLTFACRDLEVGECVQEHR